ncbi:MAG: hypothetical protein AB1545_01570 [Thermodesulfobacteriota bacterium]
MAQAESKWDNMLEKWRKPAGVQALLMVAVIALLMQGCYVSRPLPEDEFDSWLRNCPWKLKPLASQAGQAS